MLGSTIIYEPDPSKLAALMDIENDVDDFIHLDLDGLVSLDFEIMASEADAEWAMEDILNDPEGMAVVKVNPQGLRAVLSFEGELENGPDPEVVRSDLELLRHFVDEHGYDHIYEFATY